MLDGFGREISYLRISVTDRCGLRCVYCMPEEGVVWTPPEELLTAEEILRLAGLAARLGIRRVRLTGGEPLLREELPLLVKQIRALPGIAWVGVTTNGVLLKDKLPALLEAGLDGLNLSLDTTDRAQYAALTRRDALGQALAGLEAALAAASAITLRLNCVPLSENEGQWVSLARLAEEHPVDVRFIELMPIGQGKGRQYRAQAEVLAALERAFGAARPCPQETGGGPSRYVSFPGFRGRVGFISAMSHQFCGSCNRVRLTASGFLKPCLQYGSGADLRALLRGGADDGRLLEEMERVIRQKPRAHQFCGGPCAQEEKHLMNRIGG